MTIETPADVIRQLNQVRAEAEKGVKLLYEAERKYVELSIAAERAEAKAFIASQGTVADRQAVAKIQSEPEVLAAELAKAELSYIKTKLKHLSENTMAIQTAARMVELQWKHS